MAFAAPDNCLQDFTVSQCTTAQYTAADIRLTDSRTVHPNCIIRIRYSVAWFVSWRYGPVCAVRKRKKICMYHDMENGSEDHCAEFVVFLSPPRQLPA